MVLSQALELGAGEEIEWVVAEDGQLLVQRQPGVKRTKVKKTKMIKLKG
jgi:antitoxin component of MazEF toxin-antitoxin module